MLGRDRKEVAITRKKKIEDEAISEGLKADEQPGLLIYSMNDLFNAINEDKNKKYFLRCSYVEIYNEQVFDLLRTEESL